MVQLVRRFNYCEKLWFPATVKLPESILKKKNLFDRPQVFHPKKRLGWNACRLCPIQMCAAENPSKLQKARIVVRVVLYGRMVKDRDESWASASGANKWNKTWVTLWAKVTVCCSGFRAKLLAFAITIQTCVVVLSTNGWFHDVSWSRFWEKNMVRNEVVGYWGSW